jgi:aminoglycoside N3'-acetyltransferase
LKYAVITPTFEPHFLFIEKYLESYKEFVTDKENVTLLFTISKEEEVAFKKITDKYCEGGGNLKHCFLKIYCNTMELVFLQMNF